MGDDYKLKQRKNKKFIQCLSYYIRLLLFAPYFIYKNKN